ncbi:MAG: XRE family transcriptional regulator [Chlorobi bacterium]|nr:XRE family transcriptional regulator [Chlorobiota bacterium]MCI0716529.1 XRE family transcriptional regulator [Chlorobiota bacterium]
MSEKAIVNSEVIKWARITAKMSIEEVAAKLPCRPVKIEEWENDVDYPTIRQAERLAQIYRRPLAVFYLPSPPKDFETLKDFRRTDKSGEYSTALTFIIRDIQERQIWIRDFLIEQNEDGLSFLGNFSIENSVNDIANDIKKVLEIEENIGTDKILKYWIDKVESKRIFVSLANNVHTRMKLSIDEVRGFAIYDNVAPFIFINTEDTENGMLFTLAHELAHIWIKQSGVSNVEFRESNVDFYEPLEVFCNEVAAELLLPLNMVKDYFKNVKITIDVIDAFANKMHVSPFSVSVRLLKNGYIPTSVFNEYKKIFKERYEKHLENKLQKKKKQKGGGDFYRDQIKKNSRAFTFLIYDSYREGIVNSYEASSLLHIKINKFAKLETYLYN